MRTEQEIRQELEQIEGMYSTYLGHNPDIEEHANKDNDTKREMLREIEKVHPEYADLIRFGIMRGKHDALSWVLGISDDLFDEF